MSRLHHILLMSLSLCCPLPAAAQLPDAEADRQAVHDAVLDYVEAIYTTQPERIAQSVDSALAKTGFYRSRDADAYRRLPMTYGELVETARTYNEAGRDYAHVPRLIEVYDVLDQTASARLLATWGVDFMLLAKVEGRWKVTHVLWQSHTPETLAMLRAAIAETREGG